MAAMLNPRRPIAALLALAALLAGFAGCCPTPPRLPAPPPPQPADEVISQLNQHASQVAAIKARGTVTLTWTDADGTHTKSADGILMLRKHPAAEAVPGRPAADVLLIGRFAGQDVFELGVNRTTQWLAFRVDPKVAYVGPVGPDAPLPPGVPFRADAILQVLALSTLSQQPDARLAMTVRDDPAINTVYLIHTPPDGLAAIAREIVVDRRTRQVSAIRFFAPDGVISATAQLGDYRPALAANDDGDLVATPVPMPHHIVITHRASGARVELRLDTVQLMPELLQPAFNRTFALPDFASQGIPVKPIAATAPAARR